MGFIAFFLLSLGLSMDTFAVSIASGSAIKDLQLHYAFRFALFFGFFQALMLLIGWLTGLTIVEITESISHWIAFGLLTFVGSKMIYESTIMKKPSDKQPVGFWVLLGLAFATSIDALSVGVSFSLMQYKIIIPVLILGLVTFSVSLLGIYLGDRFGSLCERKMAFIGGLIIIVIGCLNLIHNL